MKLTNEEIDLFKTAIKERIERIKAVYIDDFEKGILVRMYKDIQEKVLAIEPILPPNPIKEELKDIAVIVKVKRPLSEIRKQAWVTRKANLETKQQKSEQAGSEETFEIPEAPPIKAQTNEIIVEKPTISIKVNPKIIDDYKTQYTTNAGNKSERSFKLKNLILGSINGMYKTIQDISLDVKPFIPEYNDKDTKHFAYIINQAVNELFHKGFVDKFYDDTDKQMKFTITQRGIK